MAANEINLEEFERIKELKLFEQERAVLNIFNSAMQNPTPEAMAGAACQLDARCPSLKAEDDMQQYLTHVWDTTLNIATSPSASDEVHGYLVDILKALRQCSKGVIAGYTGRQRLWGDLPLFGMHVESTFMDPAALEDYSPHVLQEWRNANSFAARLTGAGILSPSYQEMNALRMVLEEDVNLIDHAALKESRVLVACDWVKHCARPLLSWAQENLGYMDVPEEDTAAYCDNGPLYKGPHTMCLQRWGFWIERFQALGKPESGLRDELREAVLEAAQKMETVERSVAHTLSDLPTTTETTAELPSQVTSDSLGANQAVSTQTAELPTGDTVKSLSLDQATTTETAMPPTGSTFEPFDLDQAATAETKDASTQVTFDPMDGGSME
ncbi:hypothetical protein PG997_010004 [Apiospora hydei]|uniref:Uncharacterized protein n=1 Tax=Apiospora hydei TaxID=1337664 RepID=A0ABR1VVS0_9PEZI